MKKLASFVISIAAFVPAAPAVMADQASVNNVFIKV
jgi:hypothetical protein